MHDPSAPCHPGGQYRSAVFFFTPEQESAAKAVKEKLSSAGKPIKTEITRATTFWMAEGYHQQFEEKRGYSACPLG